MAHVSTCASAWAVTVFWRPRLVTMRVCDLFAGLGGFTCGALKAGARVVLAVDSDPVPLKLLGANAPQTTTVVATLGEDEVDLPPPAPDLHIHLSTPCTELSIARNKGRTPESINNGLDMIRWAVELVLERGDSSWSLENVATKATRALLSELQAAHPERVAFALFDSADFGAPQSRVRLIAGPKKLIRNSSECCRAYQARGECRYATRSQSTRSHHRPFSSRIKHVAVTVRQPCARSRHRASLFAPATGSRGATPTARA